MSGLQRRYKRDENFVFRQIDSETILVPIRDNVGDLGSIYNLNAVGAFIWQQLDGGQTLEAVASLVAHEFDVSEKQAQIDLYEFIEQLEAIDAVKSG